MNRNPLFRETALAHLASPEQLDERLQVVAPRGWLALAALGGLLTALGAWGIFGLIPVTISGDGAFVSAEALTVFVTLAESRRVQPAMPALIKPATAADSSAAALPGVVKTIAAQPASHAELLAVFGDEALLPRGPRIAVTIALPTADELRGTPCAARIVIGRRRPVAWVLGR